MWPKIKILLSERFFRLKSNKAIVLFEINTLELVKMNKFVQNKHKDIKFGTENAFFAYFYATVSKTLMGFEINTHAFVEIQSLM